MQIRKITAEAFTNYAESHPLRSYHQSLAYAKYKSKQGYNYEFIALVDQQDNIHAASLILFKKLGFINKYGYAPKGFLCNYYDEPLIKTLVQELKKFYYQRNFAFLKINPEIAIGEINPKNKKITYNNNTLIKDHLTNNGFIHLGPSLKFESLIPRFNAIIPLKSFSFQKLEKPTKNKIRKSPRKGLTLIKGTNADIETIYNFVKNKKNRTLIDYQNYEEAFSQKNDIEYFLIQVNYEQYLIHSRELYEQELERNNQLVEKMIEQNTKEILKQKMASDSLLLTFKNDIIFATKELVAHKYEFIAGAITIKYQNRISIITSGYAKKAKRLNPNHFLHYELCKHYQDNYDFIDLNGITGDFSKTNPYYGLNQFKLSFSPKCFEYIGEFDLIINPGLYKGMKNTGLLRDEFQKKQKN